MDNCCLCGREKPFDNCCQPYLTGETIAPTAEALMRSRYSAFCTGNLDYLMATHHIDPKNHTDPKSSARDRQSLASTLKTTRWLNLLVIETKKGKAKDKRGTVEFVAAYQTVGSILSVQPAGEVTQMHERSQFVKVDGQWRYTTGDMLPLYQPKPTAPCWCGSRQKFRQCHG